MAGVGGGGCETRFGEAVEEILGDVECGDSGEADYEEDAAEEAQGHRVQDCEEGAGHDADEAEGHEDVGEALFADLEGEDFFAVVDLPG